MQMCKSCFKSYDGDYDMCPSCGYVQSSDKREVYHLPAGTVLKEKYVIGRVLGSGGFGNTYKAWDKDLERFVAVKEYYPSGIVNRVPGNKEVIICSQKYNKAFERGKNRFLEEARYTAKFIKVPTVVHVFDHFEENNTAYFIMEYIPGITLREFLKNSDLGRFDFETSVSIISKVAQALKAVHDMGVIHRDVAPDNIFILRQDGNLFVKLIDFGAARFYKGEDDPEAVLKPGYAPPEQYIKNKEHAAKEQGPWTDVYALGATMYHLITGLRPDESTNRKIEDTVPYPHMIDPSIPVNISNAIMRAMAIERHLRFQNIEDFEKAIRGEIKTPDLGKVVRRRKFKRVMSIAASFALVVAAMIAFYISWSKQRNDATLPDATIEVWCVASADYDVKTSLEAVAEQFKEGYNSEDVVINITTFPADEYLDALEEAIDDGEAPDLFESTGLADKYLDDAVSLSSVVKGYFKKNCLFYSDYSDIYDGYKRVPLAFNYKVVYVNNVLYQNATGSKYAEDVAEDMKAILKAAGMDDSAVTKSYESFFGGEYAVLDGSTEGYMSVVNNMAGKYHLVLLEEQDLEEGSDSGFCYEWSIMTSDKDERTVAERLLEFMLSDYAQSELEITPNRNMLPINEKTLDTVANDIFGELAEISKKAK